MNVLDAMAARYSTRMFEARAPERATVEAILRNAGRAPSRRNDQPWKVHVFQGDALADVVQVAESIELKTDYDEDADPNDGRTSIATMRRLSLRYFEAPVGILCTMPKSSPEEALLDHGCFVYGIELAAMAFGLNACVIGAYANLEECLAKATQIDPGSERLTCGVALGYSEVKPRLAAARRPLADYARFNWS